MHVTELDSDDGAETEEDDRACVVSEDLAQELHTAYMAHQNARSRYKEAVKGRGFDAEAMREKAAARLKLAKERSYCSACKRKGHWHKDAECPLNKRKPVNRTQVLMTSLGGGEGRKAHEAMVVEVHVAMRAGQGKLLMILDTACASSVVGYPTLTAYMEEADGTGVEYMFEPDDECFKFGASRVFKADFAAWLPVRVGSQWIVVRVAVVACDVPFL